MYRIFSDCIQEMLIQETSDFKCHTPWLWNMLNLTREDFKPCQTPEHFLDSHRSAKAIVENAFRPDHPSYIYITCPGVERVLIYKVALFLK